MILDTIDEQEAKQLQQILKDNLSEEQVVFARTISVCSVIVELQLLRATKEDIVFGLYERFGELVNKEQIEEIVDESLGFGIASGLFEYCDDESVTLTEMGMFLGSDWLRRVNNNETV